MYMRKNLIRTSLFSIVFSVLLLPGLSFAQVLPGTGTQDPTASGTATSTPDAATFDFSISNPVKGFDNLPDLVQELLEIVILIAIPIVAVMIIYAGYMFVTARGNETKLTTAKTTLLYVVIGATIILGAKVIATAIQGTVSSLT